MDFDKHPANSAALPQMASTISCTSPRVEVPSTIEGTVSGSSEDNNSPVSKDWILMK
jgi:hypothetical protein